MRSGSFVIGAVILALAAVGVLIWTDLLDLSQFRGTSPATTSATSSVATSSDDQLVKVMNEAAAGSGFVATFADGDLNRWQITDGHRLERFRLNQPTVVMARVASSVPRKDDALTQGLSIELPAEFAQRMNGKRIVVGVLARTPQSNGVSDVSLVYATRQAGNSGWKSLALTSQFELRSFTFDVPQVAEGYTTGPIIAIHADNAGQGRAVEILGLYVKQADS